MNKRVLVVLIIILLGGAVVYGLTRDKEDNPTPANTNTSNTNTQNQQDEQQSETTPPNTNAVSIENFAFSPSDITVKKGTTVTWTNNDSVAHTVTETDGKDGPDSEELDQGQSYSFTFDTVGTYRYKCTPHPNMLGSVVVTE